MSSQTLGPPQNSPPTPPPAPRGIPDTDQTRAESFRDWSDDNYRFITAWKTWAYWEDEQWQLDPSANQELKIMRDIDAWVTDLLEEAAALPAGPQQVAAMAAAKRCASYDHARSTANWLKAKVSVDVSEFDSDPYLLGVQNGVVDLRTGNFREVEKDDMILKRCAIDYNAHAMCPMWEQFLEQVMPDESIRTFLQRAMGYTCTGITTEQVLLFMFGFGQNGKSTFIETIEKILGPYSFSQPAALFLENKTDASIDSKLAELPEKRLVVGAEMANGAHLAEARIKDLTGGDTIHACKKFCAPFNFKPTHKLWFYGNYKPIIRGTDTGIWRRIILLPFTQQIADEKRDRGIVARLWSESEGILNWMIEGARTWHETGLKPPPAVLMATQEYKESEDLIGQFFEEQCEFGPGLDVARSKLSFAFECWMKHAGYKFTFSPRSISDRVSRMPGVKNGTKQGGVRHWSGVALKDPALFV